MLGEYREPRALIPLVSDIVAEGGTSLYTALDYAVRIAESHGAPGFIILLTDGQPTDVYPFTDYPQLINNYFSVFNQYRNQILSQFNSIKVSEGFKVIAFGVGSDFIESILALLAEKTGGFVQHIDDPREIGNYLPQLAVKEVAGKDVMAEVDSVSRFRLLNYPGSPVSLGALEGVVKIYGEATVPPLFEGDLMTVRVRYENPVTGEEEVLENKVTVKPTKDKSKFLAGINRDLMDEYNYFSVMGKLLTQLGSNDLAGATSTLQQMEQIARQTRRLDLIESTRKLLDGLREDPNTATKRLISEVTNRMR